MNAGASATTTYGDLLRVAGFPRAVGAALLQRLGGSMLQVAIVLFVLEKFHSPKAGVARLTETAPVHARAIADLFVARLDDQELAVLESALEKVTPDCTFG